MPPLSRTLSSLCLALTLPLAAGGRIPHPDHHEFEAALTAPFVGEQGEARTFRLLFRFPDAESLTFAAWRLELTDAKGRVLRTWRGETPLGDLGAVQKVYWDGRDAQGRHLAAGHYSARLVAMPLSDAEYRQSTLADQASRVEHHLQRPEAEVQAFDIQVGSPARPAMRPFKPLPTRERGMEKPLPQAMSLAAPAPASLPYTVYSGNLHSQTNHSDGGGDVATCTSAQSPQTGAFGPTDAFAYAKNAGLDLLMASEHNHMYDGSTGTNTATDPAAARALFASGLGAASNYSAANPGFLAIYGMEWGVITNGGHLNILNPDGLANWELNASGQVIGDYSTPKGDYAGLYTFMRSKGWVGQFNHAATTGQFLVGTTPLAYTADGDEVMALHEILNTSAYSVNTTETETGRSSFEAAWKILLERGYHVAPSTDQDNHCANWGRSYTNRTSVLIPTGTPLTMGSFLEAVRARRVFATMDKSSQIILRANGHLMGERFASSGPLTLTVDYASTTGQTVAKVEVFEGVPGRNGTVTLLSSTATTTITPTDGSHFYYAKITQANGDLLWSAPVWVNQGGTPASTVTAAITAPAADLTVDSGTPVAFAGTGTSSLGNPLTFTWAFGDGATATGASANHAFSTATTTTYTVTLTATDGSGSGAATRLVTVNPVAGANTAPTLVPPASQTLVQDTTLTGLAFTVGDAETAATALTVTASSSDAVLLPNANLVLGGSGSNRTLGLTPAAGKTGTCTVTLTVTDGGGLSTTGTFTVTVTAASSGTGSLIISQYYEGAASDKWIELTNVGGASLNLTSPQRYLALYSNTAADAPAGLAPSASLALTGTLAPGQSLLFKNSATVLPSYAMGTASGVVNFNGDDLVILSTTNDTTAWTNRLDVVGNGNAWGADTSFVRNAAFLAGNPTYTPTEWLQVTNAAVDSGAVGTTERLGEHLFSQASRTVTASIDSPAADLTVASGATIAFAGSATDSAPGATLAYAWTFGDGGTASGATASHAFTNNGSVNQVFTVTLTATGETEASGSATRLVTVTPAPDTTAPAVSATETGTQGTITLSATATDNVSIAKVDFYVDGVLKGTDTTSPYSLALDSTTLTNATHSLVAKATDAAGNVGTSAAVGFTVSNPVTTTFNEVEANNTKATANAVGNAITTIAGYFPSTSDNEDWYSLTLGAGSTLTVDMTGPTASAQDYDLYLYGSSNSKLASSTKAGTTERVTYKNPSTAAAMTIYIRVLRYASYSSVTPYTLTLTR